MPWFNQLYKLGSQLGVGRSQTHDIVQYPLQATPVSDPVGGGGGGAWLQTSLHTSAVYGKYLGLLLHARACCMCMVSYHSDTRAL